MPVPGTEPRAPLPTFSEEIYAQGLSSPTAMAWAPDGRLFIAQKGGTVRVVSAAGALLPTPFVSITVDSAGERGLIGIALDPDFVSNGHVYVHYTRPAKNSNPPRGRIDRYTAAGDIAAPGSKQNIVKLDYSSGATNHNGGAIHFGTDGKLYIAVGDTAVASNAQTLSNRHGKLLRYNPDGTIPADNPFYGTASGENRSIWALGLRNPFTFAVHPNTGQIFINDVGPSSGSFEEVNLGAAGANYGWPDFTGANGNPSYTDPIYSYPHAPSGCTSIAGGTFYVPNTPYYPAEYTNDYFFSDYCFNDIWVRDSITGSVTTFVENTEGSAPVDLSVGPDGALYYLAFGSGRVIRIAHTPPVSEGELVGNGSFEADIDPGPNWPWQEWKVSDGAKRTCKNPIAGACSLMVKGAVDGAKASQKLYTSGLIAGTTFAFSATVRGKNLATAPSITLKLVTDVEKKKLALAVPSGTFAATLLNLPAEGLAGATFLKANVQIKAPGGTGKLWVDDVSVIADAPDPRASTWRGG
ncbi:MAG: PQQ-dependent sugar dehydrogenase [Chloroflexi bacterium]|nr:PQQ-dependent sugar dehydrogenase [Chloroflexota bacterium]